MAGLSFTEQINKDIDKLKSQISADVTAAGLAAWDEAVDSTPVDTGNLRSAWGLSNTRRSSYVPAYGRIKGRPSRPNFRFRSTIDKRVYLFNNVPYASYVENGEGRGVRVPRMMMRRAINRFNSVLQSRGWR